MGQLSQAGWVWLGGISRVEWNGWMSQLSLRLQVVYQVDIVTEGVLIFVRVCNFCSRLCIGWGRVGWVK